MQCLHQTHKVLTELLYHEHASLPVAQRCSGLSADTPLFSTLLNYRHLGASVSRESVARAWQGMKMLGNEERTNYPITLSVNDRADRFELVAQVTSSVSARRILGYLTASLTQLNSVLSQPALRMACELEILSETERTQLRRWGINTGRRVAAPPVSRMVEDQVHRVSNAPAVICGQEELSYAQLNRQANQLAHRLIAWGVKPETPVGIALEPSLERVVGILAILKAGGAYVPLDPQSPAERLRHTLSDSGIELLLTQRVVMSSLPTVDGVTVLDLDALDCSGAPDDNPQVPVHPDNLAYVIYTSGSTGRPKGVAMRHGAVTQLLQWHRDRLPGAYRTLQFASICFDVSFQEIFTTLTTGGCLVIAPESHRRDMRQLVSLLREAGVERLMLPFAVLQHFGVEAMGSRARLPQLRQLITAGEQLKITQPLQQFLEIESQCTLINQYGPTESHVVSDFIVSQAVEGALPPIGEPIAGTCLRILDGNLGLAPTGVIGELHIGGTATARAYLNRPGLTADRFIADPLSDRGERLYRTGDQVRWNDDGQLEYLGRMDYQVKIRGFRIELGEIESQLLSQPEVRAAAVVADTGASGSRLLAYVAGSATGELDPAATVTGIAGLHAAGTDDGLGETSLERQREARSQGVAETRVDP